MSELTATDHAVVFLLCDYQVRNPDDRSRPQRFIDEIKGIHPTLAGITPQAAGEPPEGAPDTWERLEEAAYSIAANYCDDSHNYHDCACAIICLLDRQAAITKAETSGDYDYIDELRNERIELTEMIRSLIAEKTGLEAERDGLKQELADRDGAVCERDGRIGSYERRNTELNDALKAICNRYGVSTQWAAEDAAKKLFESIDSTHMRLPVDADGVPIRVGDYLQGVYSKFEVCAVSEHYAYWAGGKHFDKADCCRHVQPDTVESLLDEMLEEARCKFHEDGSCEMGVTYGRRAEYAERIRKAVEHGD